MAPGVKELAEQAWQPEPPGPTEHGRRELTQQSCLLTSTCDLWHACPHHTHTHTHHTQTHHTQTHTHQTQKHTESNFFKVIPGNGNETKAIITLQAQKSWHVQDRERALVR